MSGISASSRGTDIGPDNLLGKVADVTPGTVNRVTNLNLLVGPSAMPVDYLIITHSSLFNSGTLTTLANHRSNYDGYDIVIVKVDDIYADPDYTSATNYVDIRDFIRDVYLNGRYPLGEPIYHFSIRIRTVG